MRPFLMDDMNLFISHSQCPNCLRRQVICCHGIDQARRNILGAEPEGLKRRKISNKLNELQIFGFLAFCSILCYHNLVLNCICDWEYFRSNRLPWCLYMPWAIVLPDHQLSSVSERLNASTWTVLVSINATENWLIFVPVLNNVTCTGLSE